MIDRRPRRELGAFTKTHDLIYVSLGSVFTDNPAFFKARIDAFGGLGRRTIISLGDRISPDLFDNVPANIELTRFAPQKRSCSRRPCS